MAIYKKCEECGKGMWFTSAELCEDCVDVVITRRRFAELAKRPVQAPFQVPAGTQRGTPRDYKVRYSDDDAVDAMVLNSTLNPFGLSNPAMYSYTSAPVEADYVVEATDHEPAPRYSVESTYDARPADPEPSYDPAPRSYDFSSSNNDVGTTYTPPSSSWSDSDSSSSWSDSSSSSWSD